MNAPKVGTRFLHRYWLDANGKPAIYTVTALRGPWIYYKQDQEAKAKEKCSLDRWEKVFGSEA